MWPEKIAEPSLRSIFFLLPLDSGGCKAKIRKEMINIRLMVNEEGWSAIGIQRAMDQPSSQRMFIISFLILALQRRRKMWHIRYMSGNWPRQNVSDWALPHVGLSGLSPYAAGACLSFWDIFETQSAWKEPLISMTSDRFIHILHNRHCDNKTGDGVVLLTAPSPILCFCFLRRYILVDHSW